MDEAQVQKIKEKLRITKHLYVNNSTVKQDRKYKFSQILIYGCINSLCVVLLFFSALLL